MKIYKGGNGTIKQVYIDYFKSQYKPLYNNLFVRVS